MGGIVNNMKISKIDHVALVSADSTASRDWYRRVFEMDWVYQGKWDNNPYFLKKGDVYLAIFQDGARNTKTRSNGVRIDHFAFRAESMTDYEDIKKILFEKGIAYDEQDHEISKSIYTKDPDEIKVEVTTYDI